MKYQRQIIGYHGCPSKVRDEVLAGKTALKKSNNPYDWLGSGIYFWEHGPDRALDWAKAALNRKGGHESDAAVIGAIIQLGNCFDLLDVRFTRLLPRAFRLLKETLAEEGSDLPVNEAPNSDGDVIRRHLDCAVINLAIHVAEEEAGEGSVLYHTVRGAFEEGGPAFPGACVKEKTHIQVAVRDPSCIVGYFKPV